MKKQAVGVSLGGTYDTFNSNPVDTLIGRYAPRRLA